MARKHCTLEELIVIDHHHLKVTHFIGGFGGSSASSADRLPSELSEGSTRPSAVPSPDKNGDSGKRLPRLASELLLPMVLTPGSTRLGCVGRPELMSCGDGRVAEPSDCGGGNRCA